MAQRVFGLGFLGASDQRPLFSCLPKKLYMSSRLSRKHFQELFPKCVLLKMHCHVWDCKYTCMQSPRHCSKAIRERKIRIYDCKIKTAFSGICVARLLLVRTRFWEFPHDQTAKILLAYLCTRHSYITLIVLYDFGKPVAARKGVGLNTGEFHFPKQEKMEERETDFFS